jgi:hypothetical protein
MPSGWNSGPGGGSSWPLPAAGSAHPGAQNEETPSGQNGPSLSGGLAVQAWPAVAGYEILGVLGRGSEGVVYKARQRALGRVVALKLVRSGDTDQVRRIRRGAELLARLNHPHIVQVYEVGVHDGLPYFALEYVPGGSLARCLSGQPLPAALAASLVEAVARGVHAAHQAGVVHRDLKPGNILLQIADCKLRMDPSAICNLQSAIPKVSDFGLARPLAPEESLTAKGAVLGTPEYMAPEQAQGEEAGPAGDVYALGAILYRLLTGRPPFVGERPMDVLLQVVHHEPLPPRRLQPKVPRDLETVCLQCLRKEPARRYGSAEALAEDLARFRRGEPVRARPVGQTERAWRWCKRHRGAALAAVVVLLALVGGVTGVTWGLVRAEDALARVRFERDEKQKAAIAERQARDQEAAQRRQAEAVALLLESVFRRVDPNAEEQGGLDLKAQLIAQLDWAAADLAKEYAGQPWFAPASKMRSGSPSGPSGKRARRRRFSRRLSGSGAPSSGRTTRTA